MPVYYTDAKEGRERNVNRLLQCRTEQEHQKFLKKIGYTPREERDIKPLKLEKLWDNYDNRVTVPTSDKVGNGLKTSRPLYTGSAVIGQ